MGHMEFVLFLSLARDQGRKYFLFLLYCLAHIEHNNIDMCVEGVEPWPLTSGTFPHL